ncbi:MAG: hypothetical protein ACTSUO_02725 [Candidatus Thorarchaeota archaeon]
MVEEEDVFEKILSNLDIDLSKVLLTQKKPDLMELAQGLISTYSLKDLADLISEEFPIKNLFTWLEKNRPDLLFKILSEPDAEIDMKEPVRRFIETKWKMLVDYEVPIPIGGRNRSIDVCGYKPHKKKPYLVAVELKKASSRGAIDKAFAQAVDNSKGVNESYVAFSIFVFLKYHETIVQKLDAYESVGVLVVDSRNVLNVECAPDDDISEMEPYDAVLEYMEKRFE